MSKMNLRGKKVDTLNLLGKKKRISRKKGPQVARDNSDSDTVGETVPVIGVSEPVIDGNVSVSDENVTVSGEIGKGGDDVSDSESQSSIDL